MEATYGGFCDKHNEEIEEYDRAAARQRALVACVRILSKILDGGYQVGGDNRVVAKLAIVDYLAAGGKLEDET